MTLKFSKVERKGPITIVTLSRPEVYNALHTDAHNELDEVFDDFASDPEQWVAIVTGAGDKAFCAGNDLKWQAAGRQERLDTAGFAGLTAASIATSRSSPRSTASRWAAASRSRWPATSSSPSENATFALPEPKVGLAALAGGLHRLPRQIGLKRAMGMILTARHVAAKEGQELGFVNEVVPQGEALTAAVRWAETICKILADVDPRLQAGDPEGHGGIAGTGDGRAARLSGGEGDGGLAGLHRRTEGVFRETRAELGGEIRLATPYPRHCERSEAIHRAARAERWIASSLRSSQ